MHNALIKDQNGNAMTNIPTDLLRTFVTIKDLGGFTSAGEFLGRSQPAISLQIKKLEEILNTKIFLRGASLELTEDGEYLYEAARQMLEINDQIIAKVRGENVSGKVRLGIPNDFELVFLPKALRNLSRVYPNIIVEVDCEISKVILQRYQKGHYDIALAMEHAKENEDRDSRDYRLETLEWVYKDSRLINGYDDPIPLIAYPQGCVYRAIMEESLQSQRHPFRFMYTSTSLLGIFSAVEEGLGITAMARSVIPEHLKHASSSKSLPELGQVCIGLYYKERELNVASRHVLDFLRSGIANI
ncbi:LysR family transcriptional regulator [Halomonas sp. MCCC 1A11062]|uniref:LysR family transcriptional regulator n=1 Tax=Halomonas sp. MCCC 1A11062 TaxID=2733485 RepID=UPI001F1F02B5|nr:LysR family transcriptional regulator [Halomonas sp. MCCC 1A11062]MCE8038734.1 LysR family transcriptional regulator [Halomonas sp. MCCC 1A11062]